MLKLIYVDEKLEWKHAWLFGAAVIIALNKVVYTPIMLLIWLIPTQKMGGVRKYFLFNIGTLLLLGTITLGWFYFVKDLFIPYDLYHPNFREDKQLNPGVDPIQQLQFILQNPTKFLEILYHSYDETLPWTLKHYVGKFGWEGNYLPKWLNNTLLYAILFFSITDKSKIVTKGGYYTAMIMIGIITALVFSIVIYMQWTPPAEGFIRSLSGRYFIPIFPLLILALKNDWVNLPPNWHRWAVITLIILANCLSIPEVVDRYYP